MRRIINSTYISLDGVIQNPQDWPGNGIEGDGTGGKVQMDLLSGCDALLMGGSARAGRHSRPQHRHRHPHLPRPRRPVEPRATRPVRPSTGRALLAGRVVR
jgi:hypothetical protein